MWCLTMLSSFNPLFNCWRSSWLPHPNPSDHALLSQNKDKPNCWLLNTHCLMKTPAWLPLFETHTVYYIVLCMIVAPSFQGIKLLWLLILSWGLYFSHITIHSNNTGKKVFRVLSTSSHACGSSYPPNLLHKPLLVVFCSETHRCPGFFLICLFFNIGIQYTFCRVLMCLMISSLWVLHVYGWVIWLSLVKKTGSKFYQFSTDSYYLNSWKIWSKCSNMCFLDSSVHGTQCTTV